MNLWNKHKNLVWDTKMFKILIISGALLAAGCASSAPDMPVHHDTQPAAMYANCAALVALTEGTARVRAYRATLVEMASKRGVTVTGDDLNTAQVRVQTFASTQSEGLVTRAQRDCYERVSAYEAGVELIIPETRELSLLR